MHCDYHTNSAYNKKKLLKTADMRTNAANNIIICV